MNELLGTYYALGALSTRVEQVFDELIADLAMSITTKLISSQNICNSIHSSLKTLFSKFDSFRTDKRVSGETCGVTRESKTVVKNN